MCGWELSELVLCCDCSLLSQVVKLKGTENVYALKILNKWEMLKRHQVSTGRDIILQEHVLTGSTCW